MNSFYAKNLSEQDKADLKEVYSSCARFRQILSNALNTYSLKEYEKSLSKSGYDSPNWSHNQADSIGYRRALKEVVDFLKDSKE